MLLEYSRQASAAAVHFVSPVEAANVAREFSGAVMKLSIAGVESDKDLFVLLAQALKFPEYFGHNWDALDECLADIKWLPPAGCVLVCTHAGMAWSQCPATFGKLISAWLDAARSWAETKTPFHLVFVVEAPVLQA